MRQNLKVTDGGERPQNGLMTTNRSHAETAPQVRRGSYDFDSWRAPPGGISLTVWRAQFSISLGGELQCMSSAKACDETVPSPRAPKRAAALNRSARGEGMKGEWGSEWSKKHTPIPAKFSGVVGRAGTGVVDAAAHRITTRSEGSDHALGAGAGKDI